MQSGHKAASGALRALSPSAVYGPVAAVLTGKIRDFFDHQELLDRWPGAAVANGWHATGRNRFAAIWSNQLHEVHQRRASDESHSGHFTLSL